VAWIAKLLAGMSCEALLFTCYLCWLIFLLPSFACGPPLQGDVLSGCIAAYAAWAQRAAGASREQLHEGGGSGDAPPGLPPLVVAAYAGCLTTRRASQRAFARQRRSMGATDLLAELGAVADELAEQGST